MFKLLIHQLNLCFSLFSNELIDTFYNILDIKIIMSHILNSFKYFFFIFIHFLSIDINQILCIIYWY